MTDDALVSCVMPTRDRRAFVPLAIDCFLRQDHRQLELLVVDDGADPVADLIPDHPAISYERLSRPMTLGAKRNLACRRAAGAVIVHWDDDDWSAPQRVSSQLRALADSGADITGLRELIFFEAASGCCWRYSYPDRTDRPWVAGGTLCYRRAAWERHPFPEIAVGEDTRFVWTARGLRIHALRDPSLYVATIHAGNTSPKRPDGRRWQRLDTGEVDRLLGADASAYRAAAGGRVARTRREHVTITVPYFACREYIRECVDSLLAQTHEDFTLVVVNDADPDPPWDLLGDIDDPRLIRFDLPENRGRYFADQVVLNATTSRYLLIHDADDWSEPTRLDRLLGLLRDDDRGVLALSDAYRHGADAPPQVVRLAHADRPLGPRFEHRAYQVGLYDVSRLRAIGGLYAGFNIGYDTFLVNALAMTGRILNVPEPLYHVRRRPGSLTSAPATGSASPLRRRTTIELARMYRAAYGRYRLQQTGALTSEDLARALREMVHGRVPASTTLELERHTSRLETILRRRPAHAPSGAAGRVRAVPSESALPWGSRTITRSLARALADHLERRAPRRIVEVGSGISTVVLAEYAARSGATLITLEHEPRFAARTRALLAERGLGHAVDMRIAPLRPRPAPDGGEDPWYDTTLEGPFDFAFVDAPPLTHGRGAVLFALDDVLGGDWELWLHDAARAHERECLRRWSAHLEFEHADVPLDERGVAVLRPRVTSAPRPLRPRHDAPVLFWSKFDLGSAKLSDEWVEQRFRTWLAFTLPSILAQEREELVYWLICDPAGRHRTEPLAACVRDSRVRIVYEDECARELAALPERERHLVARIDSDDLYAPGVAGELTAASTSRRFLQFNRGFACDVRSGETRRWLSPSSPFYCQAYGSELRKRTTWSEPNHTTLRGRACELAEDRFLVLFHGANDSSRITMGRDRLSAGEAHAALRIFGLGASRSIASLLTTARGRAKWRPQAARELVSRLDPGEDAQLDTAAAFVCACDVAAPRRILVLGDCATAAVARRAAPGCRRTPGNDLHDVVLCTDGEQADAAVAAVDPTGLLLLAGGAERLAPRCADRYSEVEELTRGRAVLAGRVVGPAA